VGGEPPERLCAMQLLVGLGNPGPNYDGTRHNVGFDVVGALAARARARFAPDAALRAEFAQIELAGTQAALLLPQTFMNASGESVRAAVERFRIDPARELIVVFDDLDLPLGRLRLRAAGGAGGHRGVESIVSELETTQFARLRFGIGRPQAGEDVVEWVLSRFGDDELEARARAIERAVEAVLGVWSDGLERAMERFNRAANDGD